MIVHFTLDSLVSRLVLGFIACALFGVLTFAAIWYVFLGTLTDERLPLPRTMLEAGLHYFPQSARLNARLADTEMQGVDRDLTAAETHTRRAIMLLPKEYTYHLQLGAILEAQGNRTAAEGAYRAALDLAPNYLEVHWRLANNLVRQGKVKESLDYFRYATTRNLALLPSAYDLIWNVASGSIDAITNITGSAPKAQLTLAQFLARQSKFTEAANVYRQIDRTARQIEPESAALLDHLILAHQVPLARELWDGIMAEAGKPQSLLWNGGFENEINPTFAQFDWTLKDNNYVRVAIDPRNGHTGAQSLRVAFLGKDTTRVEGEIKQLLLVKPGKRYRIEYFYKIQELMTPMGPRVAVTEQVSQAVLAASEVLPEGTHAWQQGGIEFTAPANVNAVFVQVQRIPKFSYDDPTRGYVWFDDFVLKELS
ncbi:MAG: hypothetical protein U0Y68_02140 [Blastocatellia bacterium]